MSTLSKHKLVWAAMIAGVVLVGGCSGGGRDVGTEAAPAGTFLDDQATVLAMNLRWLPLLFPLVYRPAPTGQPNVPDPVPNPDGTFTWTFTDSDGTKEVWDFSADFLTETGTITTPDGEVTHVSLTNDPNTLTTTETRNFPDGSRLDRTIVAASAAPDPDSLLNSQTGTIVLSGGQTLDFKMWQYGLHFVLQVDAHEGWVYNLTTPTVYSQELPDATKAADGSLMRGSVAAAQFVLPANPSGDKWQAMSLTAPGSISGTYSLTPIVTGSGTVNQAGQLLMTVLWGTSGLVNATLADGRSQIGQPSAAARDFLIDQWLWALAESGPNPR